MKLSRREVLCTYATTLVGVGMGFAKAPELLVPESQEGGLTEARPRALADLPLNPDGSAPERPPKEAGVISEPTIWRYTKNETPAIDFDYRRMKLKMDTRGTARLTGTVGYADLEKLPRRSYVVLMQCGGQNPRGVVKWTGVRFSDVAEMLGTQSSAQYCRIVGSDKYFIEEDMRTMMHPQVMLAWMLNDEALPPKHGAPLRLIIPFRYGARSVKAVTEILFTATSFPHPQATG